MAASTARVVRLNLSLPLTNLRDRANKLHGIPPSVIQKLFRGFTPGAITWILCVGFSFFSVNASAVTASVGATVGAFAVNPSGAATYTIPIAMAPGTNGMQPKLALAYNSQTGNGLLGMGWSIAGLSVIHRCGATIVLDGVKGGVNYDANDRFCLDGERLISVGGNEYRTQHESWQRIIASDATSNPASFTVYAKDGTIREYGANADSRIEAAGRTDIRRLWALNKISDRNGNYLTITYTEDNTNGDFRPYYISYTGNSIAGVSPNNIIVFEYSPRSDVAPIYEGGSKISSTQRLTFIRSYAANAYLVREYRLDYDNYGAVGRSRLISLQECAVDACHPATQFGWQNGGVNFTNATWTGQAFTPEVSSPRYSNIHFGELNGDGKADAVAMAMPPYSYSYFVMSYSTGSGYSNIRGNSITNPWEAGPFYADVTGDGKEDFIRARYHIPGTNYENHSVVLSTGENQDWQAWLFNQIYPWDQFVDLDGDGRADYVSFWTGSARDVSLSTGAGYTNQQWNGHGISTSGAKFADLNGDGKTDYVTVASNGTHSVSLSTGSGFINQTWQGWPISDSGVYFVDVNGDGKADGITVSTSGTHFISLSTGTGYDNLQWSGHPLSDSGAQFADMNGDGKMDYVSVASNGTLYISLSTGSGYVNLPAWTGPALSYSGAQFADLNGDGLDDYVTVSTGGQHYISLSNGPFPDLLATITDGLDAITKVTYKPLTDNAVYQKWDGGAAIWGDGAYGYPYQDVQNATYVVSQFTQSNGVGSDNATRYEYTGLKKHLTANVSLGFRRVSVTNPAGFRHDTLYNQALDGREGTVAKEGYTNVADISIIKLVDNTWTSVSLGNGRSLAQLTSTLEQPTDLNGAPLPTTTTTYSNPDAFYNPQTIVVSTSDLYKKTTTNTYKNDATNWLLGQLTQSQVTAYAPDQTPLTRTSTFVYDYSRPWLLWIEAIEPADSVYALVTSYGYDPFGNRTSKTIGGVGITTRTEYQLTYDTGGQFVKSRKNAKLHIETYDSYDLKTGAPTQVTDANGVVSKWQFDGFGRKELDTHPDGSTTTYIYSACDGTCFSAYGAKTITTVQPSGAGTTKIYRDMFGREVRTASQGLGGALVYRDTAYDYLGRVVSISHPYFITGEAPHYTTYTPDKLGRITRVTEPGPAGTCNSPGRTTITTYNGLTTTVTNPLCQTRSTVKNSQGQVVQAGDAAGTTNYQYDPFGNLIQVTDPVGNVTKMTYDIRGRKRTMQDPDMGAWTYTYNVLDQLTEQKDAKGQIITMKYDDLLGRLTQRILPNGEGTSAWTYDTAAYGKGKLASVSNPNATETYVYDSLSRPTTVTTSIGGVSYDTTNTYDANSRPLTLTYPTGFKLYHVYDSYGNLTGIRKDSATGIPYWFVNPNGVDAHGRLTSESFGNDLIAAHVYHHETGDLQSINTSAVTNATAVQNLDYTFDALGNLLTRTDNIQNFTETFHYDEDGLSLNRLTSVTGPAPKTYGYDEIGNLTSKSDVGTYAYNPSGPSSVRPHAVTGISGGLNASFTYDDNGNLLTGNGRTVTYTAFNKPKTIIQGGQTTTLAYDAHHRRLMKTTSAETTVYLGRYEKITSGGIIGHKHHLYAGNAQVATLYQVSIPGYCCYETLQYLHTDHLGSVDTITDNTGQVSQRLSYDAFGKRRNPNGMDATGIIATSTRGYTRHEHDDEVKLINMSAREYDPLLGRFITPDTFVPGGLNSQAYNRYSYVINNPLSLTDPTGHGWNPFKSVSKAVKSIVNAHKSYIDWHVRAAEKAKDNPYVRTAAAIGAGFYLGPLASGLFEGSVFGTSVAVGFTSGYVAGYTLTGDPRVARQAGVTGGIFGGVAYSTQDWNAPGRIGAKAVTGGVTANLQGGDFRTGFIYEGASATASWGYQKVVGIGATPEAGRGLASEDGRYRPDAETGRPPYGYNVFGDNERLTGSFFGDFFKQGGALSVVANQFPGANAGAYFHDTWMNQLGSSFNAFTNYSTMPAAAAVSYGALLDGPLSVQLAVDRSK